MDHSWYIAVLRQGEMTVVSFEATIGNRDIALVIGPYDTPD